MHAGSIIAFSLYNQYLHERCQHGAVTAFRFKLYRVLLCRVTKRQHIPWIEHICHIGACLAVVDPAVGGTEKIVRVSGKRCAAHSRANREACVLRRNWTTTCVKRMYVKTPPPTSGGVGQRTVWGDES